MKAGIFFEKLGADTELVELKIDVCDGYSIFSTSTYGDPSKIEQTIADLNRFKDQLHGGIANVQFGEFGPEYARGAFHVRLHFQPRGLIHLSVHSQGCFREFGTKSVAPEAFFFLVSEPVYSITLLLN